MHIRAMGMGPSNLNWIAGIIAAIDNLGPPATIRIVALEESWGVEQGGQNPAGFGGYFDALIFLIIIPNEDRLCGCQS